VPETVWLNVGQRVRVEGKLMVVTGEAKLRVPDPSEMLQFRMRDRLDKFLSLPTHPENRRYR
jgi:hypothetical protein